MIFYDFSGCGRNFRITRFSEFQRFAGFWTFDWKFEVPPKFSDDLLFWIGTFFRILNVRLEIRSSTEIFGWPVFLNLNVFGYFSVDMFWKHHLKAPWEIIWALLWSQTGSSWTQIWFILISSWANLGEVVAKMAQMGAKLVQAGAKLGQVSPNWAKMGRHARQKAENGA